MQTYKQVSKILHGGVSDTSFLETSEQGQSQEDQGKQAQEGDLPVEFQRTRVLPWWKCSVLFCLSLLNEKRSSTTSLT